MLPAAPTLPPACPAHLPAVPPARRPSLICASVQMLLVWHVNLAIMMAATPELRGSGSLHLDIVSASAEVLLAQKRVSSSPCIAGLGELRGTH